MNFLNLGFYAFIVVFFTIYYIVPNKYRYIVIFAGSYFFYGYSNPKLLIILVIATIISYAGGWLIPKFNYCKAIYATFFILEIALLGVFKYTDFIINNINLLLERLYPTIQIHTHFNLVMPIGLSFIVFQACTYLSDIYRKKMNTEKNIVLYGAFVSFFPTVLSGPIQKARKLIPQISNPSEFNYDQAQKGVLLFVWGLFEKILVANNLMKISTTIVGDYLNHSSAEILIAAISFSLYVYADFASYSDMARGIGKVLGIDVGMNFNNPYLSITTSEFWTRWHMSLNEWFVENVYIPLGGNRKGVIQKYFNMMIVFGISGLWHGADWHFVAWGLINGIIVVLGQIIAPAKEKLYQKMCVNEKAESIVFVKRVIVFFLITLTWIFFTAGIMDSLRIWKRILFFDFVSVFNPQLLNICGTTVATFVTFVATLIFCVIQYSRQNETTNYIKYKRQPFIVQCFIVAVIICVCIFAVCNTDANVDTQFLYFQF